MLLEHVKIICENFSNIYKNVKFERKKKKRCFLTIHISFFFSFFCHTPESFIFILCLSMRGRITHLSIKMDAFFFLIQKRITHKICLFRVYFSAVQNFFQYSIKVFWHNDPVNIHCACLNQIFPDATVPDKNYIYFLKSASSTVILKLCASSPKAILWHKLVFFPFLYSDLQYIFMPLLLRYLFIF